MVLENLVYNKSSLYALHPLPRLRRFRFILRMMQTVCWHTFYPDHIRFDFDTGAGVGRCDEVLQYM